MLPKDGQQFKNIISETSIAFGSITGAYTTLVDLGTSNLHSQISVSSDLDNPISLKFVSGNEITFANETFAYDNFAHDGVIQIKHNGAAPSSGSLKIRSW